MVEYNVSDMHRRLGDPVHIDEHRATVQTMLIPILKSPEVQRLTAKDHMTQAEPSAQIGILPLRLQQLIECRWGLIEDADALERNQRQELLRGAADRIGDDTNRPPCRSGPQISQTEKSKANEWNKVQTSCALKRNKSSVAPNNRTIF